MSTTLGLDIGTNSIGWALVKDNQEILGIGTRIFPIGVKEDDYNKTGKEISKNENRRIARGARRLNFRYKLRRTQLINILSDLNMLPDDNLMKLPALELYKLRYQALEEKIGLKEIGRIFLLLNQRRGFKSNKKEKKSKDSENERSKILKEMDDFEKEVKDANCRTAGEYFYTLFCIKDSKWENSDGSEIRKWRNPDEPKIRIRSRHIRRKMYEEEFDKIWNKQKEYYPDILIGSPDDLNKLNDPDLNLEQKKILLKEIKETNFYKTKIECIFYQRRLKSQKGLVGKCRFEPNKRVTPKSSILFQEFRIWQRINDLRITTTDGRFYDTLTLEEKQKLFNKLNCSKELSRSGVIKALELPKDSNYQKNMPEKIKGNTTRAAFIKAFGSDYVDKITPEELEKLWHTLYFADDEEWLKLYAREKLNLNLEQVNNYLKIDLEPDYGSVSQKALKKILPFLEQGFDYATSCQKAGYNHSGYEKSEDNEDEHDLLDKIPPYSSNIKNPLVQQSISESIRLINAIVKEYGKPDKIKIELVRELQWNKKRREEYKRKNDDKQRMRDQFAEFLKNKLNISSVSKSEIQKFELWLELAFSETDLKKLKYDIDVKDFQNFVKNIKETDKEKYTLWLECNRICPYTGEVISLTKLFSPEIEIEHILPYSRSLNNSFSNKTLTTSKFNNLKGNSTPYEYFRARDEKEWQIFLDRIKVFPDSKVKKFIAQDLPAEFTSQQLNNSAYIAVELRDVVKQICSNVEVTSGAATSYLRKFWGLNSILNPGDELIKSRGDHRHHAVDALVIACTTFNHINLLSRNNKFNSTDLVKKYIPKPWDNFYEDAKSKIDSIIVSIRNKKRLVSVKKNKYKYSTAKNKKYSNSVSVRGVLHEETVYGKIFSSVDKEEHFVIRKPLSYFTTEKQIEKVVDPQIKKILKDKVQFVGGKIQKAFPQEIYMKSNDNKKEIPIKKVRTYANEEKLVPLKPLNQYNKYFVAPGNNYLIAIYQNDKSKRQYKTVSFFEAVKALKERRNIYPLYIDDFKFQFALKQNDAVLIYNVHPDEIDLNNEEDLFDRLYRVIKFDANGVIVLGKLNIAKIMADRDKSPIVMRKTYNTLNAVKVNINILGQIIQND